MKVNIWISTEDAVKGNVEPGKYWLHSKHAISQELLNIDDLVQVSISVDEFAKLEDNKPGGNDWGSDHWLLKQYNRNRLSADQVKSREDIPYIYERNPDSGKIRKRPAITVKDIKSETAVQKIGERDYSIEKGLEQLCIEMKKKTSVQFTDWFHKLTKNEQTRLAAYYND